MFVRRNSLVPVTSGFDRSLDRLFRDVFAGHPALGAGRPAARYPAVNASEDEKNYHVEAELPGWEQKDLNLSVIGNELTLSGNREEEQEREIYHQERWSGDFSRVIRFPVEIDDSRVTARYDKGVLYVTLPKAAAALPRKIEVKG